MNSEFQDCLKGRKIQEFSRGTALVEKELKAAEQDLGSAKESLQKAKILRENADYYDDWSESTAKSLIKAGKQFLEVSRKLAVK